jgi:hypothetical protein
MPAPKVNDAEFIELWRTHKSGAAVARALDMDAVDVRERRRRVELRHGINLESIAPNAKPHLSTAGNHGARFHLGVQNGTVIVFSDAHFWPGLRSTAYDGLIWAIREMQPTAVICNGDAFDGSSISRFPRIGWDKKPSVIDELHACEIQLGEIEDEAKRARHNTRLVWTLGNHDARFENRLAQNAPEFEGVQGFTLKDHFPAWTPCWSCWATDDVIAKHRWKGGIHATHMNTVNSGKNMVTGHLHSLKVTPFSDYNGVRWGVDTGTLADIDGLQFVDYMEDNPANWRSGFAVLTFHKGKLLWPEVVHRFEQGKVEFRGRVIDV